MMMAVPYSLQTFWRCSTYWSVGIEIRIFTKLQLENYMATRMCFKFLCCVLTQVLQWEEISCHKTLAKFQCQILLCQISSQIFRKEEEICYESVGKHNWFKNWKTKAKQASAQSAFRKNNTSLPPLPPFSGLLILERQQTTIWSRHNVFMDEKSWTWFLSRWKGQAYGLVIWTKELLCLQGLARQREQRERSPCARRWLQCLSLLRLRDLHSFICNFWVIIGTGFSALSISQNSLSVPGEQRGGCSQCIHEFKPN